MNPFSPAVAAVVRREFMQRVKAKWFLLSTLGLPVLIIGITFLGGYLVFRGATDAGEARRVVGVADPAGLIGDLLVEEMLADSIEAVRASDMEALSTDEARGRIAETDYDLLLMVPAAAGRRAATIAGYQPTEGASDGDGPAERADEVEQVAAGEVEQVAAGEVAAREAAADGTAAGDAAEVVGEGPTTLLALDNVPTVIESSIRSALQRASVRARLASVGIESVDPGALLTRTGLRVVNVTESGEARSQELYRMLGLVIGFIFYFVLIFYGQMILRAALEEKQSDIVEVLVSSLRPWEMMLGKILGIGAVGIAQMAIWAAIFGIAAVFGLTAGASTLAEAGIDLANLPIPWGTLAVTLIFLLLGYLLYAGMFAAAGATCSNEQDAQQAMFPIVMLIILPFMAVQGVTLSPNAGWAVVVSLIPFFSPLVMTARMFIVPVPVWQWLLAVALLALSVMGAAWVAGRIYRVGMLMKGQRASLPEVVRWIRHG